MADDRFSDFDPAGVEVPETWEQWWDAALALAPYGIDPYTVEPPAQVTATGPRPAYTLP